MRKLLLISSFLLIALQTFSYSPKNAAITTTTNNLPIEIKGMTVQEFLLLTPKKYQEITGRRMTFKQKISFSILKAKLKKQLPDEKVEGKKSNLGLVIIDFWRLCFRSGSYSLYSSSKLSPGNCCNSVGNSWPGAKKR